MPANWFNSGGEEQVVGKTPPPTPPPRRLEELKRARLLRLCSQNIIIRREPARTSATLSLFGRRGVRSHPITPAHSRRDQTAARLLMKCNHDDGCRVTFTSHLQCCPPHQNYSEPGWTDRGQIKVIWSLTLLSCRPFVHVSNHKAL